MLDFPRLNAILETPKNKKHKLNTCSVDKKQANDALDEWINSLDCVIEDDDEEEELYTPRRTFNPAYQRLYACIADRAIHPEKADSNEPDLPPVNPEVIQRLSPHPTLLEKSQEAFDKVQSIFTLKKGSILCLQLIGSGKEEKRTRSAKSDGISRLDCIGR
jgi:hypothetical protein